MNACFACYISSYIFFPGNIYGICMQWKSASWRWKRKRSAHLYSHMLLKWIWCLCVKEQRKVTMEFALNGFERNLHWIQQILQITGAWITKGRIHIIYFRPISESLTSKSICELRTNSMWIDVIAIFWQGAKGELYRIVWLGVSFKIASSIGHLPMP